MILLEGAPALSPFRRDRLQARLNAIVPGLRIRGAWHGYWIDPDAGARPDLDALKRILQAGDGAGEVAEVGAGVTRWQVGDRVVGCFFARWDGGPANEQRLAAKCRERHRRIVGAAKGDRGRARTFLAAVELMLEMADAAILRLARRNICLAFCRLPARLLFPIAARD